jgi:septum formation protein
MMLHRLPALANTRLVLASASPRRVELLKQAGLPPFDVRPSSFEEDLDPAACGGAAGYAIATAAAKVDDVVACILAEDGGDPRQTLVLAADTVVESAAGAVLEKPADADHAAAMLASLSGTTHAVHTGVALRVVAGAQGVTARRQFAVSTRVTFASLTRADIDAYIATGEPYGKAGAYGIQGAAGAFVERVEGCYANVVGLPLNAVTVALADMVDSGEVGQWKTV